MESGCTAQVVSKEAMKLHFCIFSRPIFGTEVFAVKLIIQFRHE